LSEGLKITSPLVSVDWLQKHFNASNLIILDATLPKVTAANKEASLPKKQIVSARFFDIKKEFSEPSGMFPNTMLSSNDFEKQAQLLGIQKDSCIVVYDAHGIYSSPRVWWMFKAMGFDNIAVLDGGLPAWIKVNGKVEDPVNREIKKGDFNADHRDKMFVESKDVLNAIDHQNITIVDARSAGRFLGKDVEPRKGVRSGHIPSSKNLPYAKVLDKNCLRSKEELKEVFTLLNPKGREMIFSCGTGITACVLALGAEIAGYTNTAVYDGSWTAWGSTSELPITI
jgi:thiosulfate/3-mercaptopyruvate sulfurtransferase